MRLTVFGANGPTGRLVVQQALVLGHGVRALTRRPDDFPAYGEGLEVVEADVYDAAAVERAVTGSDAVISTVGVPYSFRPIELYSRGTGHIVAAMGRQGVRRLLCVSSSTTYPVHDAQAGFLFNHVVVPLISQVIGRTTYEDMRRMENLVRESDLDWTIVRPSGLFMGAQVTPYQTAENFLSGRFTARADLADSMLRQLNQSEYSRKAMAVITTEGTPSPVEMLRKEVFKRA